jgi:ribosomal protein S18 acetylase RimI-like enzyme
MANIREMTAGDLDRVITLLRQTGGVTVRDVDSKEALDRYLNRNPGFSFIAEDVSELAGFVMSGHDGRRGYLHHLILAPAHRNKGLATRLVNACLDKLEAEGIRKSHIDVFATNGAAMEFWQKIGWQRRTDIVRYSFIRGGGGNA